MFKNLFKNKVNEEPVEFAITPCAYENNEHCSLVIQLHNKQELKKEIKSQIDHLNKDGRESLSYFIKFLREAEKNGFRMHPMDDCARSYYNISRLEYTINEHSSADIWRITEELKTYRNKADIISEKQRALKAVEDDISDIKSKLGIE